MEGGGSCHGIATRWWLCTVYCLSCSYTYAYTMQFLIRGGSSYTGSVFNIVSSTYISVMSCHVSSLCSSLFASVLYILLCVPSLLRNVFVCFTYSCVYNAFYDNNAPKQILRYIGKLESNQTVLI